MEFYVLWEKKLHVSNPFVSLTRKYVTNPAILSQKVDNLSILPGIWHGNRIGTPLAL